MNVLDFPGFLRHQIASKGVTQIDEILKKSAELESDLLQLLTLDTADGSEKITSSKIMCTVAFEHAESARILIASRNFTSALGILRMQYEALVRAMWILFSASDTEIEKISDELTHENAKRAQSLPMVHQMLKSLEGKAPIGAIDSLKEFKEYSWKPLNSFVHGGIHVTARHSKGYPIQLLDQVIRSSNCVSLITGMLLVQLTGDPTHSGKLTVIQSKFLDCLPAPKANDS